MTEPGLISGVSISHSSASIEELDAASWERTADLVAALAGEPCVSEAFALQTCNRIEGYVVTETADEGRAALAHVTDGPPETVVREMGHEESLRHLLRVAAGLESLVLGEDQIIGQLRDAYETARERDSIGPVLEAGITKAIHVGERARTETAINEGVVSLASAAVRLARETHGLAGGTAVVIGAGEMGALAAKRLAGHVNRVVVANRTRSRATHVAGRVTDAGPAAVETATLDDVGATVEAADVVISATGSSEHVLPQGVFADAGRTFVVDIARPRDIPPTVDQFDHVTVYDLDRLEAVTEKTWQMRRRAAERVEGIVDAEFERLLVQYKRKRADTVISAMYESAERIKARELETAVEKLDLDQEEVDLVESMADSIVSQLLAAPTSSLRDAAEKDDWSTIHTALRLFDPTDDEDEGSQPFDSADVPGGVTADDVEPEDIPPDVREQMPSSILEQLDD